MKRLIPAICLLAFLAIDTAPASAQGLVTGWGSGLQNRYPLRSANNHRVNTGSWSRHYPAYYYGNRSINRPMVYNSRWYQKHIKPTTNYAGYYQHQQPTIFYSH